MKRLAASCMVTCLICTANAYADEDQPVVYVGKLASKDIVLTFSDIDRFARGDETVEVRARYFYRHIGRVIPLVPQADGRLSECVENFHSVECEKSTGLWTLPSIPKTKPWPMQVSAQWRANAQSAPQLVTLVLKEMPVGSSQDMWSSLLGTGPTQLTGKTRINGLTAAFLKDRRSGAKVVQLIQGFTPEVMERFNKKQIEKLINIAAGRLENLSLQGGEYDTDEIEYISTSLVTVAGQGGGYYGGNHSVDGYGAVTYRVATGDPVDIRTEYFRHITEKDVFRFKGAGRQTEIPRQYLKDQRVIEGLVLAELEKFPSDKVPLAHKSATGDQTHQQCFEEWKGQVLWDGGDDSAAPLRVSHWNNEVYIDAFSLMPVRGGLGIYTNSFAEANRGCRSLMMTIPWHKVQPYLTKRLDAKD